MQEPSNSIPSALTAKFQKRNWLLKASISIFLLSIINCGLSNLILFVGPARNEETLYWPILFYSKMFWLTIALGPFTLIGIALLLVKRSKIGSLILIIAAGLYAFLTFSFLLMGGFQHLQSISLKGQMYHLGREVDVDGYSKYALCRCDSWGFFCQCDYFYSTAGFPVSGQPELSVKPGVNELDVQLDGKVIYRYGATQQCYSGPKIGLCVEK